MGRRGVAWAGVLGTLVAAVAMLLYWRVRGLEEAGWLAGVLGTLAGMAALALTLLDRVRPRPAPAPSGEPEPASAPGRQSVHGGGDTINTIRGVVSAGPLIMGRDIIVADRSYCRQGSPLISTEGPQGGTGQMIGSEPSSYEGNGVLREL